MKKDKGKYNNLLTFFLILIFVAFIILVGPTIFNYVKSEYMMRKALSDFDETTNSGSNNPQENEEVKKAKGTLDDLLNELNSEGEASSSDNINSENGNSGTAGNTSSVINYEAIGKIEIPKTNVNYPIYANISRETLEAGIAIAFGAKPNEVGNMVLYGHNFRNDKFFSNNKKLKKGDTIYITDLTGNRVAYVIYNIYITNPTDANYMIRDTANRREISLQTCTDNNASRLIIWATAD